MGATLGFAWILLSAGAAEDAARSGFEDGWGSWRRLGAAEFAIDTADPAEGERCARITVGPDAEPAYQRIEWDAGAVREGERFAVSFRVRSEGIEGPGSAYGAFEFQNAAGERVGIAHSKTGVANGAYGWESLTIEATAPAGVATSSLHLVLHSRGSAWFDDVAIVREAPLQPWPQRGDAERQIRVRADVVVQERFGGVGFHVFDHIFPTTREQREQVIEKRWREMNPSFARLNDAPNWDRLMWDRAGDYMARLLRETGTEIYLTTWDPPKLPAGPERAAYAERTAERIGYWIRDRGCTNIRNYCMTNELSLEGWGTLAGDLETFRDYHRELRRALDAAGLDVGLLATDASPVEYWGTLEWASREMDDITAVYGAHHYFGGHEPTDERFEPWFREKLEGAAGIARARGKDFILGEFGCRQDGRTIDGIKRDVCVFWDTAQEPLVGIQLADAVIAALNAGVYGMGYWTYMDFPDDYAQGYINKWGTFRWEGTAHSEEETPVDRFGTRAHYYAYGLLTRAFRGPGELFRVETDDPWLRAAALRHQAGTWSLAVVNRASSEAPVCIALEGVPAGARFRRYLYDPAHVPWSDFGDLQAHDAVLEVRDGLLADRITSGALAVYTTAYDDDPPGAVTGLAVAAVPDGVEVRWEASPEADLCYYRVYRCADADGVPTTDEQIASTVGLSITDRSPSDAKPVYRVVAVDRSGNAGAWR